MPPVGPAHQPGFPDIEQPEQHKGHHPARPGTEGQRLDPVLPLGWLGEEAMELTHREWSLLSLLVNNMGQVVGREDVLAVWQTAPQEGGAAGSNALEVYVHRLRRKLNDSGLSIRNVRGLGYMLESDTP